MLRIFLIIIAAISLIAISGCQEATNSDTGKAIVQIFSVIPDTTVNKFQSGKGDMPQQSQIEEINIIRIRILISRIIFHKTDEQTNEGDQLLKEGPLVLTYIPNDTVQLANGLIPQGTYDKIKFEVHRFSESEIGQWTNDLNFKDFATTERYSVIIIGDLKEAGETKTFRYSGTVTVNLTFDFPEPLYLPETSYAKFYFQVEPDLIFKKGTEILDPRDANNGNDIDNAIKDAIKLIIKQ